MSMLSLENVSAGYDGTDVLHGIDLLINGGEFVCVIGPNGCGKTTLLRVIAGLLPYRGNLSLQNQSVKKMRRKELAAHMALLSQISQLYYAFSIYDTVMHGRYHHLKGAFKKPSPSDHDAVRRCLQTVGLLELKDRMIDTLSGGQLQRVYLARTLAQEPSIILLDEPTNHLDLRHQMELMESLKDWCRTGERAVIGVLHDINLALAFADRIALLHEGRLISNGAPVEVLERDRLRAAFGMDVAGYMKGTLARWEHLS